MRTRTARIIHGIPGPSGEPGVLLLVPVSEALEWDLKEEIASTARYWMPDRQAWWVAKPYAATAVAIVSRLHGPPTVVEEVGGDRVGWKLVGGRALRLLQVVGRWIARLRGRRRARGSA